MCIYFCMLIVFFNSIEKLKQSLSVNSKEVVAWFLFLFFSPPPLLSPLNERTWTYSKSEKIFSRTRTDVLTPSALWRGGCQSDSSPRRKRRRRKRRRKENTLKYYTDAAKTHPKSSGEKKERNFISLVARLSSSFFPLIFSRRTFLGGEATCDALYCFKKQKAIVFPLLPLWQLGRESGASISPSWWYCAERREADFSEVSVTHLFCLQLFVCRRFLRG